MQIYITQDRQEDVISDYVRSIFIDNELSVYLQNKIVSTHPAHIGDAFVIKRTDNDAVKVEQVPIPDTFAGKVGYCLSFAETKVCSSFEEFTQRVDIVKEDYPSKKFVVETDNESYAFLVAKKPQKRMYAPLLLWVSDDISMEKLSLLIQKYRKYRKIYHPKDFTDILMNNPNRPLI